MNESDDDNFVFAPPNLGRYKNLLNPRYGCNWREVADLFGLVTRDFNGAWFVLAPDGGALGLDYTLRNLKLVPCKGTTCWYAPDEAAMLAAVRTFHSLRPDAPRDEVLVVAPTLAMLRNL